MKKKLLLVASVLLITLIWTGIQFAAANADLVEPTAVYGSLAIDGNQGRSYGFSYNYPTMEDADEKALYECGRGCYIVERFTNGCAAYAADQTSGSSVYGWGKSSDGTSAQNRALSECQQHGGERCIVRVWGCNSR